jgi:hypothetical protein
MRHAVLMAVPEVVVDCDDRDNVFLRRGLASRQPAALKEIASQCGALHLYRCLRSSSTAMTATTSFFGEAWHHANPPSTEQHSRRLPSMRHAALMPVPEVVVDCDNSNDVFLRRGLASRQPAFN